MKPRFREPTEWWEIKPDWWEDNDARAKIGANPYIPHNYISPAPIGRAFGTISPHVTDSTRKIVDITNLLGDTLYSLKPVAQYLKDREVVIVCAGGLAYDISRRFFKDEIEVFTNPQEARNYWPDAYYIRLGSGDVASRFTNGGHIAEAFARALKQQLEGGPRIPDIFRHSKEQLTVHTACIIISPFSVSSNGNKTFAEARWRDLLKALNFHLPIMVLKGNGPSTYADLPTYTAKDFLELESWGAAAKVTITVDNGIGHLFSALGYPVISLWPKAVRSSFIAPTWASLTEFVHIDPRCIASKQLIDGVTKALGRLRAKGVDV